MAAQTQNTGTVHKEAAAGYPLPAYTSRADGMTVWNQAALAAGGRMPHEHPASSTLQKPLVPPRKK